MGRLSAQNVKTLSVEERKERGWLYFTICKGALLGVSKYIQ
ncbi:hypothetical protein PPEP_b1055 [Pseudoalteromonas peptidolytica F12-50-A1]|uniref:Uncharacterized protein n=1 Tax=Pseudoalteromonas peptidolytica F12-50-A1 TaxID=1315280 RepID=A0A8I0N051_9GAMM|nr:hypothetical protein [Pseudoalteromonas peptidolytica F12-50-A1]